VKGERISSAWVDEVLSRKGVCCHLSIYRHYPVPTLSSPSEALQVEREFKGSIHVIIINLSLLTSAKKNLEHHIFPWLYRASFIARVTLVS
jgi:hypothetical protein